MADQLLLEDQHSRDRSRGRAIHSAGGERSVGPARGAVVALAVAWSRLRLGAHTEPQLIAGFGLGAILGWALFPLHRL